MSTWNNDSPWSSLGALWTWDSQPIMESVSLETYAEIDVDSDHVIIVSMLFPVRSGFSFAANQTLTAYVEFVGNNSLVTGSGATYYNLSYLDVGSELVAVGSASNEYNVTFEAGGSVTTNASVRVESSVSFTFEGGLQALPGSYYLTDGSFELSGGLGVSVSRLIEESLAFNLFGDISTFSNHSMQLGVSFDGEVDIEVALYSWGRPVKPEKGSWSHAGEIQGTWTPEAPSTGNWSKKDGI